MQNQDNHRRRGGSEMLRRAPPRKATGAEGAGTPKLAAALAACHANPAPLTTWERGFLARMARRRRPPSARQRAMLERIAGRDRPDFAAVNRAALVRLQDVCRRMLPDGRRDGRRWRCGDLTGGPGQSLSVVLRGYGAGRWADFATGQSGGDPVSLVAAITGDRPAEAARKLARMLGLQMGAGLQ